jgi:hypothetical protein
MEALALSWRHLSIPHKAECHVHVPARGERLILPEGMTPRRFNALRLLDQFLRPLVRLAM